MMITRETDYALRILRALTDGELHTVGQISKAEFLPQAFAYKILKKLEKAKLIEVIRGTAGGCRLSADLSKVSLYDLMMATGERSNLSSCMDPKFQCPWRDCHQGCKVHHNLVEIQETVDRELRSHNLRAILTGR
ncbi:MAG TPA: Rrf2 family transcriptional regulator [Candidatus Enterenecus stercoripullorum]|nr:Rrf2 family transcriptional regulator [Candidatus Enterenecus stercoripullorum]